MFPHTVVDFVGEFNFDIIVMQY